MIGGALDITTKYAWRVPGEHANFKDAHHHRHGHSAPGYLPPNRYAAQCRHTHHQVARDIN